MFFLFHRILTPDVGINDNIQPRNLLVADALIFLLNATTSSSVSLLFDASFSASWRSSSFSMIAFRAISLHFTSEKCFICLWISFGIERVIFAIDLTTLNYVYSHI